MARDNLSIEQMTAVLDNVPTAVYVSAVDSRRLLYANRLAKEMFPKADSVGVVCYTIAGFENICPFCRTDKMNRSELTVREYKHPVNNRIYQLSGKLIDWAGEDAHIEYIVDITDKKLVEKRQDELLNIFENISCGLCIYRIEGEKIFPIIHNRVFYEIMGYSEENIRHVEQETSYLNVHPEDLDSLKEKFGRLLQYGAAQQHTYRLWNDKLQEYRWIHLEGTIQTQENGMNFLYGVYSDVSEQKRLEKELICVNEKMEDIINAIPGGVAIYKVSDIFETVYFSDGVPEL